MSACICQDDHLLENLEMSGSFTDVRKGSGIILVREKWPKTVYC